LFANPFAPGSGVYVLRLISNGQTAHKAFVLLR
jgi:hypothetical protein